MLLDAIHTLLLATALCSIVAIVFMRPRTMANLLFAILAISLLFLAVGALLPATFVVEQQFIALGTFATCNVFWLLTRCLFRKGTSLTKVHYSLAGGIAALILISRVVDIFVGVGWLSQDSVAWFKQILSECLRLLSSGVLLMAFWEIIRGYQTSNKRVRGQKLLLAVTMFIAVFSTRIVVPSLPLEPDTSRFVYLTVRGIAASAMLITLLLVLWMQHKDRLAHSLHQTQNEDDIDEDELLYTALQQLMIEQRVYLNSELKMLDVAHALSQPEYKISKVLREKTTFDNFNHFINLHRIEHAKSLLTDKDSQRWTILVVSMESGFSSLATFNRVFKQQLGCTPNQYRKQLSATV